MVLTKVSRRQSPRLSLARYRGEGLYRLHDSSRQRFSRGSGSEDARRGTGNLDLYFVMGEELAGAVFELSGLLSMPAITDRASNWNLVVVVSQHPGLRRLKSQQ
jgi:hypothetical protein